MSTVRTRFAPSPTGSLHVGNARIAVLNWAVARHHGGAFIVRIEDTDAERNVPGAERALLEDLDWLGLDRDEGPGADGDSETGSHGPYRQSGRMALYRSRRDQLLASGHAYRCFCSPETLDAERARAAEEGRAPRYRGTCRALDPDGAAERAADGKPHVIRLATPERGEVVVEDVIRGRVVFDAAEIGDFVLVRTDGLPTYNCAVVVDDLDMAITHVIRGAGHLSNTPHQLLVYAALGAEPPVFAHAPTVLGPDRRKLSKREGARPLGALREEGLHPDAVVNYLSLLGWSSPSGEEVLERDRLVREVTLDRLNAGDVVFDEEKMRWLSGQHIQRMTPEALAAAVRPYVEGTVAEPLLEGPFETALGAIRSHLTAFSEAPGHLAPLLGPAGRDAEARVAALAGDGGALRVLAAVRDRLAALPDWKGAGIQAALKAAGAEAGAAGRALYLPVRVALTGEEHGPPLPEVAVVQGRRTVLERLKAPVRSGAAGS